MVDLVSEIQGHLPWPGRYATALSRRTDVSAVQAASCVPGNGSWGFEMGIPPAPRVIYVSVLML